jgi:hypothetical protein
MLGRARNDRCATDQEGFKRSQMKPVGEAEEEGDGEEREEEKEGESEGVPHTRT